jgi:hypothetical protein
LFLYAFIAAKRSKKKPMVVIFDTDIGPDNDDVGAIAVLGALADSGEAKILATMGSNKCSNIAIVLSVFNAYFKSKTFVSGHCNTVLHSFKKRL